MIYAGYDVLEDAGDGRIRRVDSHERGMITIGAELGKQVVDDVQGVSELVRQFSWCGFGAADVAELRAFHDARAGRLIPCWVPSLELDLALAADALLGAQTLTIVACGYAELMFPYSSARRHVRLWIPGGGSATVGVGAAVNNGDGTETLSLDQILLSDFPASSTVVSFMRLCRLESDELEITWVARGYQTADLAFRELPAEYPTPVALPGGASDGWVVFDDMPMPPDAGAEVGP